MSWRWRRQSVAVAEHQPLAGDALELLEDDALPVVAVVLLQNVPDVVGMDEEERPPGWKRIWTTSP